MQSSPPAAALGRRELVAFVACLMAINSVSIDVMLPALPAIGRALGIASANHRQWIVTAYLLGFGVGQLVYGPLADRFGRRPVLLAALAGTVGASLVAGAAGSFATLLAARLLQGFTAAATRVLSVAIVRDLFEGRAMARIMSLSQMIFFVVPILAPSLGQGLLALGSWRVLFHVLTAFAGAVLVWAALRLPETLLSARRVPISPASLLAGYRLTLTNRFSLGYACASTLSFGAIIAFVSSSQQIFEERFATGTRFPWLFALCALAMGVASFANSRLVERLGTRLISQTAVLALIALSVLRLVAVAAGREDLVVFMVFQALSMTAIGLCGSNFNAMAMEPMGAIAGAASSVQGFIATVGAVAVGSAIGQAYDGTTVPLALGYLAVGLAALALIGVVERGRLFEGRLAAA